MSHKIIFEDLIACFSLFHASAGLASLVYWQQLPKTSWNLSGSRWPTNSLAQCVSSHFKRPVNWPGICWLILEKSCTNVLNATNHLVKLLLSRGTCSLTVVRRLSSVLNATNHLHKLAIWDSTLQHTVVKRCTNVLNATNHSHGLLTWGGT